MKRKQINDSDITLKYFWKSNKKHDKSSKNFKFKNLVPQNNYAFILNNSNIKEILKDLKISQKMKLLWMLTKEWK